MSWLRDIDRWFVAEVLPYAPLYRARASRFCGIADADDLVQDAYARVLATPDYRAIGNARAFMLTVIHNLAIQRLRRANIVHIDHVAALDTLGVADTTPDAFAVAAGRSELDHLMRVIDTLPTQCRLVLTMRKIDGLPPRAIAEVLGISVSTVEKHLAKGIVAITRDMQRDSITARGGNAQPWKTARND